MTNKNDSADNKKPRLNIWARLRRYLIAGILVSAPISITIYVTYVFLNFMDTRVAKILPDAWYNAIYGHTFIPGVGLLIAILFFIVVGWFARNFMGRIIIQMSEYIVHRMPIVNKLYGTIKQILETVMASQSQAFREVVMLEYPRKEVWSIGFVTGVTEGEVQEKTNTDTINVFVPTTPNPTSGYLLFVPKKQLKYLDMTVEEGIKLVMSAGIVSPPTKAEKAAAIPAPAQKKPLLKPKK